MTSRTKPLTEQEALEEQLDALNESISWEEDRDVKKLRRRLFAQSDRIKGLVRAAQDLRAKVRTLEGIIEERQKIYDDLLQSSVAVVAALRDKGFYDKKEETE